MATEIILRQIIIFGIIIGLGALGYWRKIITPEIKNNLSSLVVDITLPFLIFSNFANMEYDTHLIKNGLLVFGLAYVNFIIFYWLGKGTSKILGLKGQQATVHTIHTMFSNTALFGFPLLDALFPNGLGVFYGALYQFASNSATFTFSIYRLSKGTSKGGWRSLINNNTIALLLGALVLLTGLRLPEVFKTSFQTLGKCTSPLSMLYIGATLASMSAKKMFAQKSIYFLSFNRLLLGPLLVAVIYLFGFRLLGLPFSKEAYFILILQAAMPCQTTVVVLAQRYNSDYELAGANLFVTTLLSIVSLPLVYYLLELLWTAVPL